MGNFRYNITQRAYTESSRNNIRLNKNYKTNMSKSQSERGAHMEKRSKKLLDQVREAIMKGAK